ncbi:MAG: ParB/RepB/Spo0J family partition protein [Xanthomonadaceae bacterium]|nr:ParB/RepB/Spo0J family partition protein [Xanthomonadaceae bacterium]
MKKRGLGRGLGVLLSQTTPREEAASTDGADVKKIAIERLTPGEYQPRRYFEEEALEALADSIKAQGIIQPIVVRPIEARNGATFEILAGERRWRASQLAGLKDVPVIVRKINDQEALAISLIENIQREDLNPIETSLAISRLVAEFELTHQEAGEVIGRSRSSISNALRLLELTEYVQSLLAECKLDMGHARALLTLSKKEQDAVAKLIVEKELTVRETERLVKQRKDLAKGTKGTPVKEKDADLISLERSLGEYLGALIEIKEQRQGKGQVVIKYNSLDELDGILEKIKNQAN